MLYAKISPPAQITVQDGPFETKLEVVEFVAINVHNYNMGDDPVRFSVAYGSPKIYDGVYGGFYPKYQEHVTLEASEVAQWGNDDSVIFNIIGEKQGFTVGEIFDTKLIITTTTTTTSL